MKLNRPRFVFAVCLASTLALASGSRAFGATAQGTSGAVVDEAAPSLPATRAGIEAGAVLLSITPRKGGAPMTLRDPFDALAAELQWSRVAAVTMRVGTKSGARDTKVDPDDWGLKLRPVLSPAQETRYAAALAKLAARDAVGYCGEVAPIATELEHEHAPRRAAWLHWRCADAAGEARDWKRSDLALQQALGALADDPGATASILLLHATQAMNAQEWERSRGEGERALAAARKLDPESALALQAEALTPRREAFQSHYAVAVGQFEPLLARIRARYPDTLLEADLRNRYALALRNLGKFDAAAENFEIALKLRTELAPQAFDTGGLLMNYSLLLRNRGDEARALEVLQRAIAIYRALSPESLKLASALSNLATIQEDRGELIEGERTLNESLAMRERLAPNSYDVAVSLQNLAHFALDRGDLENAERLAARGQQLFEQAQPDSNALANAYHFHGLLLERRGDLPGAEAEYQRALALMKKLTPDNIMRQAFPIHDLGGVAEKRGQRERARQYYEDSLAMRTKAAPGGLDEAESLSSLGALELADGNAASARARLERARASYAQLAPESRQYALALHRLGLAMQRDGKGKDAVQALCEAARVLDRQRRQVSVSRETQAEYVARYAEIPRACAEAEIAAGAVDEAFAVIEQSRARALRERLGARDEVLAGAALPPDLRAARAGIAQQRAKLEGELAALYKDTDAEKRSAATKRLADLQADEEAWFRKLAQVAPRYAHVLGGEALSAPAALAHLTPDAAAIVYVVGPERSYLLSLSGKDRRIRAVDLHAGRAQLEAAVLALRERIVARESRATLDPELARAYRLLIAPAEAQLKDARRLLVVGDGALQLLPFGALIDAQGRFVAERWVVSIAPSVTVALEDSGARPAQAAMRFAGVAVPEARRWPANAPRELPALPGTEAEVRAAAAAYGDRSSVLVGAEAQEPAVRAAAQSAAVLHLAAHGYFDPDNPIDSGLLLVEGGARQPEVSSNDDGVVHAWEVMANWRLSDTRLVVLSACDTGLGRELAGEGLIGLTRAFEYAGARNVVATLWPITDRTTAPLMSALHGAFAGGGSAALALRDAQRALIASGARPGHGATRGVGGLAAHVAATPAATGGLAPSAGADATVDASHPYYWAGFEVFGAFQ